MQTRSNNWLLSRSWIRAQTSSIMPQRWGKNLTQIALKRLSSCIRDHDFKSLSLPALILSPRQRRRVSSQGPKDRAFHEQLPIKMGVCRIWQQLRQCHNKSYPWARPYKEYLQVAHSRGAHPQCPSMYSSSSLKRLNELRQDKRRLLKISSRSKMKNIIQRRSY